MANEQSQNEREEYQIDEIKNTKEGYSKCVHMRTRGEWLEKVGHKISTY